MIVERDILVIKFNIFENEYDDLKLLYEEKVVFDFKFFGERKYELE